MFGIVPPDAEYAAYGEIVPSGGLGQNGRLWLK
jgi:hypothetical protein